MVDQINEGEKYENNSYPVNSVEKECYIGNYISRNYNNTIVVDVDIQASNKVKNMYMIR